MARSAVPYAERVSTAVHAKAFDVDEPEPGYYRMRLVTGAVFVGVRIWFGPPLDPVTGEELDRSYRWQAVANDKPIPLERVWPKCGRDPIDAKEYAYLTSLEQWGKAHAPNSPQANPTRRINLMTAPIPEF